MADAQTLWAIIQLAQEVGDLVAYNKAKEEAEEYLRYYVKPVEDTIGKGLREKYEEHLKIHPDAKPNPFK